LIKGGARAVFLFDCSKCGARPGQYCTGDDITKSGKRIHQRRLRKLGPIPKKRQRSTKKKKRSVWTVSGGAFETNRRRASAAPAA